MNATRRLLMAGNWKMNGLRRDAVRWAEAAVAAAKTTSNEVALFPPYPWLEPVGTVVGAPDGPVALGAQLCHTEPYGAFTGAVSAAMIADAGCRYVLCGHSERRHVFGETDEDVAASLQQALAEGVTPVLCVGETITERKGGQARAVVLRQLDAGLEALPGPEAPLVVAYEPVWALGTGLTASPNEANEAHGWIRGRLTQVDPARAEGLRILYGGSVKPGNIDGLLAGPDVDGVLVGGASLDPDAFARIIQASPAQA
jgi:triosephosphate isomerase